MLVYIHTLLNLAAPQYARERPMSSIAVIRRHSLNLLHPVATFDEIIKKNESPKACAGKRGDLVTIKMSWQPSTLFKMFP